MNRRPNNASHLQSATIMALALSLAFFAIAISSTPTERTATARTADGAEEIVFTLGAFNRDLYAVEANVDGEPRGRRLTDTAGVSEAAPDWSPDGRRIAYTAGRDDGPVVARSAVWVLDTATSENAAVSFGPEDNAPDWSPDGTRIAFAHVLERGRGLQSSSVSVVDPSDPAPGPIVDPLHDRTAIISAPKWSPDGKRLIFVVETEQGGDLYALNADGTDASRLLEHDGWDDIEPAWSPDGLLIAFASGFNLEPGASRPNPRHGIWLLDLESGRFGVWLTDALLDLRNPSWSPTGDRIAFEARPSSGTGEVTLRIASLVAGVAMPSPLTNGAEPDWSYPIDGSTATPTNVASATATTEAPPTATFPVSATPPLLPGETPFATLPPFPTLPPPGPTVYPPHAPTFPLPSATPEPSGGGTATPIVEPTSTEDPLASPYEVYLPLAASRVDWPPEPSTR